MVDVWPLWGERVGAIGAAATVDIGSTPALKSFGLLPRMRLSLVDVAAAAADAAPVENSN